MRRRLVFSIGKKTQNQTEEQEEQIVSVETLWKLQKFLFHISLTGKNKDDKSSLYTFKKNNGTAPIRTYIVASLNVANNLTLPDNSAKTSFGNINITYEGF